MLVFKIIICILSLFALLLACKEYNKDYSVTRESTFCAIVAGILGIIFCGLLVVTRSNIYFISKIMVYICVCICILLNCSFFYSDLIKIPILITFVVTLFIFINDFKESDSPKVTITTYDIVSAKDDYYSKGNTFGLVTYIKGELSEEAIYRYYYKTDDGGFKQGSIPVDSTTIYFVEPGETAYVEKIVTDYYIENESFPSLWFNSESTEIYKMYVPKDSIQSIYKFNTK